jgi:hypothetical protein
MIGIKKAAMKMVWLSKVMASTQPTGSDLATQGAG